jgi:ribonuclease III
MKKTTTTLEKLIGYTFKDKQLLKCALTHKTFAFEATTPLEYNERLEFLGDSILNFVIAERLYHTNTFFSEGELTRRRALLVNNQLLAEKAKKLQLGSYMNLGKGEKKQQGNNNPSNLANCLEAIFGAIYLDSDLPTIRTVIFTILFEEENN